MESDGILSVRSFALQLHFRLLCMGPFQNSFETRDVRSWLSRLTDRRARRVQLELSFKKMSTLRIEVNSDFIRQKSTETLGQSL